MSSFLSRSSCYNTRTYLRPVEKHTSKGPKAFLAVLKQLYFTKGRKCEVRERTWLGRGRQDSRNNSRCWARLHSERGDSLIWLLSRAWLCDPMDCSTPGSLPFTMSGRGRGWLRGHCHVDGRQIWCLRGHGEIGIKSFESTRPRDSVDRETPAAAKELIAKLIPPSREKMRTPATKEGINWTTR